MSLNIRKEIELFAQQNGFTYSNKVFYRIENDVIQGFTIQKKISPTQCLTWMSIQFRVYPLCGIYQKFDDLIFETYDIGELMSTPFYSFWPFYYTIGDLASRQQCATQMVKAIEDFLLPHFFLHNSCLACYKDDFGMNRTLSHEPVFFALKAGDTEFAITRLNAMIQQRLSAYESYIHMLKKEQIERKAKQIKSWNEDDLMLIDLVTNSSPAELNTFLSENEMRNREMLDYHHAKK